MEQTITMNDINTATEIAKETNVYAEFTAQLNSVFKTKCKLIDDMMISDECFFYIDQIFMSFQIIIVIHDLFLIYVDNLHSFTTKFQEAKKKYSYEIE